MRSSRSWTLIALVAVLVISLLGSGTALAADSPQGAATEVVGITVTPDQESRVAIAAQYATAQGQALADQEVSFFLPSSFMGQGQASNQREVFLARATTDDTGTARVYYTPTWDGTQGVIARLTGGAQHTAAEVTALFDVTASRGLYEPELSVLAQVREWTPVIVASVVMAFWVTMGLVLLRSSQGILAAGRSAGLATRGVSLRSGIVTSRLRRQ